MASPLETQAVVVFTTGDPQTHVAAGIALIPPIGSSSLRDTLRLPGHFVTSGSAGTPALTAP